MTVAVGQHGSAWHTAEVEISSAYRAFSKEKVMGTLGSVSCRGRSPAGDSLELL